MVTAISMGSTFTTAAVGAYVAHSSNIIMPAIIEDHSAGTTPVNSDINELMLEKRDMFEC